jgi:hypothetical protein
LLNTKVDESGLFGGDDLEAVFALQFAQQRGDQRLDGTGTANPLASPLVAARLRKSGVEVDLKEIPGIPHLAGENEKKRSQPRNPHENFKNYITQLLKPIGNFNANGSSRRVRGGSWWGHAGYCAVANQDLSFPPSSIDNNLGFRLARNSGN